MNKAIYLREEDTEKYEFILVYDNDGNFTKVRYNKKNKVYYRYKKCSQYYSQILSIIYMVGLNGYKSVEEDRVNEIKSIFNL